MTDTSRTVRIFISSPGDVVDERDRARRVIDGLGRQYPGVALQPILWEDLALPVTASFQESIDFVLDRDPIDIAVFILWSRLGTPLGAMMTRPDGTPYRSGTEREFELMLAAFEQSERQRPVILAYTRDDDAGFKQKLAEVPNSELEEFIAQQRLTDAFVREQFFDSEGHNIRAVQSYREPVAFSQRLRIHLRHALDDLLGTNAGPRWLGEPYRGLDVFDVEHAPIFHGRDEETCDLLQRLREQRRAGCAFVVIVGASGSGKSSLARAGVAASLVNHAGDDGEKQWRVAVFLPAVGTTGVSQSSGIDSEQQAKTSVHSLFVSLTDTLAEAIPELEAGGVDRETIAAGLAKDCALTVQLSIAPAFKRSSAHHTDGPSRTAAQLAGSRPPSLLLVLDQLEELWTDRNITTEVREQFLVAIEAMARRDDITVLATLRSDFYPQAQQSSAFLRMKGEHGHVDLMPPGPAALSRLITEPARLAGVQFERHEQSGLSLDEVILQDASRDPAALPLLQYALAELYRGTHLQPAETGEETRHGPGERRTAVRLTFAAYESLGGVEGALGRRAEQAFKSLPGHAQAALNELLPLLITIDVDGDQAAVRRRVALADLTTTSAEEVLATSMIAARLLTTDRQGNVAIVSLTHEALLRRWDRIAAWITSNREYLRLRARVEHNQRRWETQDKDTTLLLPAGLPLEEARQLIDNVPHVLADDTSAYIRQSLDHHASVAARRSRRRRAVIRSLVTLTMLAVVSAAVAVWQAFEAREQRMIAERETADATAAAKAEQVAKDRAVVEQRRAIRTAYNLRLRRVADEIPSDPEQALSILADCPVEIRDFTWRLFRSLCPTGRQLRGHEAGVNAVCFSPDGQSLATASDDHTVRVWSVPEHECRQVLSGHSDEVLALCFSSDGERLVSGSKDRKAIVWNIQAGQSPESIVHATDVVRAIGFADNDRFVIGTADGQIRLVNVKPPNEGSIVVKEGPAITCMAVTLDGVIYSGNEVGTLTARNLSGSILASAETRIAPDDASALWALDVSRDHPIVLAGTVDWTEKSPSHVTLRDKETLHWIETIPVAMRDIHAVAVSDDASAFAIGGLATGELHIWKRDAEHAHVVLRGHSQQIWDVAFAPDDNSTLASASYDGSVMLWNAPADDSQFIELPDDTIHAILTADCKQLAVARRNNSVFIGSPHDTDSFKQVVAAGKDSVRQVTMSHDGSRLAALTDTSVVIRGLPAGSAALSIATEHPALSVAFNADGHHIGVAFANGLVRLYAVHTSKLITELRLAEAAGLTLFSPYTGHYFACSDAKSTAFVDIVEGAGGLSFNLSDSQVLCAAFSPDGQSLACGCYDGRIRIVTLAEEQPRLEIPAHRSAVLSVDWSPDGKTLVSIGDGDSIRAWDPVNGQFRAAIGGSQSRESRLRFNSDSSQLYSVSASRIRYWTALDGSDR